jgi:hypothetical protein
VRPYDNDDAHRKVGARKVTPLRQDPLQG